jgi:hypothetical protein
VFTKHRQNQNPSLIAETLVQMTHGKKSFFFTEDGKGYALAERNQENLFGIVLLCLCSLALCLLTYSYLGKTKTKTAVGCLRPA